MTVCILAKLHLHFLKALPLFLHCVYVLPEISKISQSVKENLQEAIDLKWPLLRNDFSWAFWLKWQGVIVTTGKVAPGKDLLSRAPWGQTSPLAPLATLHMKVNTQGLIHSQGTASDFWHSPYQPLTIWNQKVCLFCWIVIQYQNHTVKKINEYKY